MDLINAAQIHMVLNHFPVVLSMTGAVIILIAILKSNDTLVKTAFWIFVAGGLLCIPAYLSGEGAEEIVEHLPDVSETFIEDHEENAKIALILCALTAMLSLAGLIFYKRISRLMRNLVFITSLVSAGLLAWTAHLGGQIRHTEIRQSTDSQIPDTTGHQENEENESEK